MKRDNQWTIWLAGILVTALTSTMFFLGTSVIANDKDSRDRDSKLAVFVEKVKTDQQQVTQEILIALQEIKTDLKYIKQNVK